MMMRWIGLLLLLSTRAWAVCDPSVLIAAPCARLGLYCNENTNACGWQTRLNNDRTYLDAHACTDDHPCLQTLYEKIVLENADAGDLDITVHGIAEPNTLVSVACHCDANCSTPATLAFKGGGAAISLTGGGDLACSTASSLVFTTFLSSDTDRDMSANELASFSVTNSPTAGQRLYIVIKHTIP